jgi:hypothetical protein
MADEQSGSAGGGGAADDPGAAQARVTDLEGRIRDLERRPDDAQVEAWTSELRELRSQVASSSRDLDELKQRAQGAEKQALDAHRRALLAEHRGQVIDELVQGATHDELDRSVDVAKQAYSRIADTVRSQAAAQRVPPGSPERTTADVDQLSPLQKIARGLSK